MKKAGRREDWQGQPWDAKRTAIYGGVYGAMWYGPFMHGVTTMWGRLLPSTTLASLAFKSGVDVCTSLAINLGCGKQPRAAVCAHALAKRAPLYLDAHILHLLLGAQDWPADNRGKDVRREVVTREATLDKLRA